MACHTGQHSVTAGAPLLCPKSGGLLCEKNTTLSTLAVGFTCLSCLLISLTAYAQPEVIERQARTAYVPLYEGVDLWPLPGITVTDPTVISLLVGATDDIRHISAPALMPLFDFPVPVDCYFGLSGDPEHPVLLVVEQLNGLAVWEHQPGEIIKDKDLEWHDDISAVALGPNQIVMLETQNEVVMLIGFAELQPDVTVRFTYIIDEPPGAEPTPLPTPAILLT